MDIPRPNGQGDPEKLLFMEQLGVRLNELARNFQDFENRFLFGGLVVVIAVLNSDLVFLRQSPPTNSKLYLMAMLLVCV